MELTKAGTCAPAFFVGFPSGVYTEPIVQGLRQGERLRKEGQLIMGVVFLPAGGIMAVRCFSFGIGLAGKVRRCIWR